MILPSGRRWLIIMAAIDGLDLNSVQFVKIGKRSSQGQLMIQDHGRNRDMERT